MRWASSCLSVPDVLEAGADDQSSWILTRGLDGRDATHPAFRGDVLGLVELLADGLLAFHRAPIERCPFQFRLDDALRIAVDRLHGGRIDPARHFHPEYAHLSAAEAVETLQRTRPRDENLVVCHGDYRLPNVLLNDERVIGYVDLGELGVADRWWDLAVGSWSITWNLGPGLEEHFFQAYGVELDPERLRFYRLLYDVVS